MGYPRFFSQNLITAAGMISVSSARLGERGSAVAEVLGAGTCYAQGEYSGDLAVEQFVVEVDTAGDVGVATFRWKGGAVSTWEANKVATSDSLISLRDGISVRFGGSGFVLGDRFLIEARRPYGRASLLDVDPAVVWRSTGCTLETITVGLGAPAQNTVLILGNHNLSLDAVITLKGAGDFLTNEAGEYLLNEDGEYLTTEVDWGSPTYQATISHSSPHVIIILPDNYSNWRLELADPSNPDGVIQAGNLYLGAYDQFTRRMLQGGTEALGVSRTDQRVEGALRPSPTGPLVNTWKFSYNKLTVEDRIALRALFSRVNDRQSAPLWFLPDSEDTTGLLYGFLGSAVALQLSNPGRHAVSLEFEEMVP